MNRMKNLASCLILVFINSIISAQITAEPIYNSWEKNSGGKKAVQINYDQGTGAISDTTTLTINAKIQRICYSEDTIFIKTQGLPDTVGAYTNPGGVEGSGFVFKFPRNAVQGSGLDVVPTEFGIGTLVNGLIVFGLSDGKSYNNQKVWVGNAFYSEGEVLDNRYAAHRQQDGVYHTHATPYKLYENGSSTHSSIVGWAFDGFPIYGPYAYEDSMDVNSNIVRMKSNYELTTASDRSTQNGITLPPPERGPSFIDAEPGTYIEDYEYNWSNGGHLDQHNGRFCKTPEFPNGIYAYFVTMDQAYTAQFPFYIGTTYYGTPYEYNYLSNPTDQTIPDHATCSIITGTVENLYKEITLFPNPTDAGFRIEFDEAPELVQVFSVSGNLVKNVNVPHQSHYYDFGDEFSAGIYQIVLKYKNASYTKKVVIE